MKLFQTRAEAEKYFKEEVETGNSIDHMCTSGCGNDYDCPIAPDFETWVEEENIIIKDEAVIAGIDFGKDLEKLNNI